MWAIELGDTWLKKKPMGYINAVDSKYGPLEGVIFYVQGILFAWSTK
jgi:hypothetical protein